MNYHRTLQFRFKTYKFCKDRIWFHRYDIDVEKELKKIQRTYNEVKELEMDEVSSRGCMDYIDANYLREVWVTEMTTTLSHGETIDISIFVIEGAEKPDNIPDRVWLKLQNIKQGLLFSRSQFGAPLSVTMIRKFHKILCNGLFDFPGTTRTSHVGASRTLVVYERPGNIDAKLATLVDFVNEFSNTRLDTMLLLSTFFFAEFLKIHPFVNGNGRVARLLVSFLLSSITVVPISIFYNVTREQYLQILGDAQWEENPVGLCTLFLLSAKQTANVARFLLLEEEPATEKDIHDDYCCSCFPFKTA